jgi:integrase
MKEYFESIPKSSEWVFYRKEYGDYCNLGDFKRSFRAACKKAGVPWLHFHDLRHQSVTEMSR